MSESESSSVNLSQFKEKICLSGRLSLDAYAYRMDGSEGNNIENMAKYADLGTPSCCDYLYVKDQTAILIEDTFLEQKMKELKLELGDFNKIERKKEFDRAKNLLKKEFCLKVYGALLILCRLMQKHIDISRELNGKRFSFWFVINDQGNIPAIDNMELVSFFEQEFKRALGGTLESAKLVTETRVLFSNQLKKELQI
ncbi:MAG: hypothetical protein OXB86_04755 [Bdellovibrionales bacterium]|nr:hypothetical protein [Bdellovibrionales bacterium]